MVVRYATQVRNICIVCLLNYFQKRDDIQHFVLIFQLFSKTMADAIMFYRERGVLNLKHSFDTEMFTRRLNDLFDCLNTSKPLQGITKNSGQIRVSVIEPRIWQSVF